MMKDTLVLNADSQPVGLLPISTISWKEAVNHVFSDSATVVHSYENWIVHSPSIEMYVPSVIMLKDYIKIRRTVQFCRENIYLRDNYICQYCGEDFYLNQSDLSLDHVTPQKHNGLTNFENIACSCVNCNIQKSHFFKMKPKNQPYRPSYYQLVAKAKLRPIFVPDMAWNDYLMWDEDLVHLIGRENE